ncbi:MAG: hypothetical protein KIH10_16100 [Candidatus Freyarchaeota archaeon]|nr:hypothetical protein [Candidatus Jordarchaeia archaeon]
MKNVFHGKPTYAHAFQIKHEKAFLVLPTLNGVVGAGGRPFILLGLLTPFSMANWSSPLLDGQINWALEPVWQIVADDL